MNTAVEDTDDLARVEREKYETVWTWDDYRVTNHMEMLFKHHSRMTHEKPVKIGDTLYDYGTGTGRGALYFALRGVKVTPIDIAYNCMDEAAAAILQSKLLVATLWDLPDDLPVADHGTCTDVMEHLPPEKIDAALAEISRTCKGCFFNIAFYNENFEKRLPEGTLLHQTVRPFLWWVDKLKEHGHVTHGIDMIIDGVFFVEFDHE